MGLSRLQEIAVVCPEYGSISEPACDAAELLWLRYLAYSRLNGEQVCTSNIEVPVLGSLKNVVCIFKEDNDKTYRTGLVLQSKDKPVLEGMILSDEKPHNPLRPFCLQADYETTAPKRGQSLRKAVEKVGLTYYVENGLAHLLSRLLLINKLSKLVGDSFWANLQTYGEYALESGLVRETWQDN